MEAEGVCCTIKRQGHLSVKQTHFLVLLRLVRLAYGWRCARARTRSALAADSVSSPYSFTATS